MEETKEAPKKLTIDSWEVDDALRTLIRAREIETNKEYVVQFNKTENASYYVLCNDKSNAYRIAKNLGIFYSNYGLNADAEVYIVQ